MDGDRAEAWQNTYRRVEICDAAHMNSKNDRRRSAVVCLVISFACLGFVFFALMGFDLSAQKAGKRKGVSITFIPVDTSAVMGSPNPLPALKMVNAFPDLKFKNPIRIRNLGDGSDRLFVGTQMGKIFFFRNRSDVTEKKLFLSIKSGHQLMDFVFHPNFSKNGYVYTYYRSGGERARRSVLSRFKVDKNNGDHVDPESEKVIIEITRSFHPGSLQFGPDGFLYFVLGYEFYYPDITPDKTTDPGNNFSNLLGTMIRIDVDGEEEGRAYRIPKDNPFIGDKTIPDEVWAYGFREPWRFCFDPKTGFCWLGDNGQWAYEEVNLILPGGNYGWPLKEGFLPFNKKYSRKARGGMAKKCQFPFR